MGEFKLSVGTTARWEVRSGKWLAKPRVGLIIAHLPPGVSAQHVLSSLRPNAVVDEKRDVSLRHRYLVEVELGIIKGERRYRYLTPFATNVEAQMADAAMVLSQPDSPPAKGRRRRRTGAT